VKKCIVIDDSRVVRKVARRILEGMHFQVEEAEAPANALESCRRDMPDAVLLDWTMPSIAASEFLRQLRKEPQGAKPTVVFCTLENDVSQISEAINSGANDYILKPFDREALQSTFTQLGLA
jgi:two-component system, chemotaxis family, chemotaxis protein CheY